MIDLFQTDNVDSEACDKAVQSCKRTVKVVFKMHSNPKQRRLPDKPKHGKIKYKICLLFCEI